MLGKIIFQVLAVAIIAYVIGALLLHLGVNIILGTIFGVLLQYGAFNLYVFIVDLIVRTKAEKIENERLALIAQQVLEVECPCPRKSTEVVPIRLDQVNNYKCKTCSKNVKVYVNAETALASDIIVETDLAAVDNLLKSKINETA